MKSFLLPAMCVVMLCVSSCKKSNNTTDEPIDDNKPVATNLNNDLLLKLVNDTRIAGCNCGATAMPAVAVLKWNNLLAAASLGHSKDMVKQNLLTHTSSNGKDPGERLTAAGYIWTAYAENVAQGQTTEQQVFNDWLKSEGHCKNIMSAQVTEMGAAREGSFWTQDFGKR